MATYFHVKPGHEQEVAAACRRMVEALQKGDMAATIKTGLRDSRHVIVDNGTRLLWATTFGSLTMPEIAKAHRINAAFQEVLDDPATEEALQHPALKPLLAQAAS
ncbi:hypothetical protein [Streptomyces sp. NPDC059909]|uniref:hypothetical protein n=1 Tax=Streptomyces sp. NPDC059909 TaxID=3346998 RepID=UPI0036684DBB